MAITGTSIVMQIEGWEGSTVKANARPVIRFLTSFDIFSINTMFTFYSFLNFVCDPGCAPVATSNFSVGNMLSNNRHEEVRERIGCLINTKLIKPIIPVDTTMDYLRMDGKQYASKVRNEALNDFDWLGQWLE